MSEDCVRTEGEHIDHDTVTGGDCWPAIRLWEYDADDPTDRDAAADYFGSADAFFAGSNTRADLQRIRDNIAATQ